jgi:Na+/H+ antiporter NhaC
MFERWASEHERAFLTSFFTLVLLATGFVAVRAALDGHATEVIVAWAGAFAATAAAMLIRHRSARLILRRPEDRRRQAEINEASMRVAPLLLLVPLVILALLGFGRHVFFAMIGGAFTAIAPVMLWIAFVLRPDEDL